MGYVYAELMMQYDYTDYGVLVVGYSHEWGEFNKEYFLQYKGE